MDKQKLDCSTNVYQWLPKFKNVTVRIMVPLIFISIINNVTDNVIEQRCRHYQVNFQIIFSVTFHVR